MSIECITGVPGAGKTYLAASMLKDVYDKKNRLIYTNINLRVPYDDYLKPLDVDKLYKIASAELRLFEKFERLSNKFHKNNESDLISLKDDDENSDSDVVSDSDDESAAYIFDPNDVSRYIGNYDKYLHDSKILDDIVGSYIVWDEAHIHLQNDGFGKADPVWIRFFSYHRHFKVDILLVTQDVSLIHRRYKPFISKFYFGQNPAKRFFSKTLKFKVYTDYREFDKYYIETINIPMKKDVFDFYDSGEYDPAKSVLIKKIAPVVLIVVSLILLYSFFFASKSSVPNHKSSYPVSEKNTSKVSSKKVSNVSPDPGIDFDETMHIIFFTCNLENCVMKNSSFVVPADSMNAFANAIGMTLLYTSSINRYYKLVAASVSESLFNDLMRYDISKRGENHKNGRKKFNSSFNR